MTRYNFGTVQPNINLILIIIIGCLFWSTAKTKKHKYFKNISKTTIKCFFFQKLTKE